MQARDMLINSLELTDLVINAYIGDLSDADLLIRPIDGMNPIAWQLGHLISSERHFNELLSPGSSPALPEGFEKGHSKDVPTDNSHFYTLEKYKKLWDAQRAATRALIMKTSESDLDRTDERFPPFAKSAGAILNLCANHPLMHAGQFVAVRRKLGKPVVI